VKALMHALLLAWLLTVAAPASAHKASDAYLQLDAGDSGTTLRVDLALRDLDLVLDLDADADGAITWGEVRAGWPAIDAYFARHVRVEGCALQPAGRGLEQRGDGVYAAVTLRADCRLSSAPAIVYTALAEADPTHRGIARITVGGAAPMAQVLDPTRPAATVHAPDGALRFVAEGVHHIVGGADHVLFLLCLLLPAVMRRTAAGWAPVPGLRDALVPVVAIVTAFTLAHSVTLALAATGTVTLPSAFVEPAIAATIVLAAIDNLRPIFGARRGLVTFVFGLVHGFSFAGVLGEVGLPTAQFAWALLQFNLGLELGQLAIVVPVVALLFVLRDARRYGAWVIGGGSAACIAMGTAWFVARTAGLALPL
jgi:hypothetical protein